MIAGPHKHSGEDGQAMPVSIALARTLYDDSDPVHDFDTCCACWLWPGASARRRARDMAVVETAVLLHDIQRAEKITRPRITPRPPITRCWPLSRPARY